MCIRDSSKEVVQKMWGEAAVAHIGMKSVQSLVNFGGIIFFFGTIIVAAQMGAWQVCAGGFILMVGLWTVSSVVFSCLAQIYRAALYIYATTNEPPRTFRRELLESAFN